MCQFQTHIVSKVSKHLRLSLNLFCYSKTEIFQVDWYKYLEVCPTACQTQGLPNQLDCGCNWLLCSFFLKKPKIGPWVISRAFRLTCKTINLKPAPVTAPRTRRDTILFCQLFQGNANLNKLRGGCPFGISNIANYNDSQIIIVVPGNETPHWFLHPNPFLT